MDAPAVSIENRLMNEKEPVLSKQDVTRAYKQALRSVSMVRGEIPDTTRQYMAEAVHEFYGLLQERIEAGISKHDARKRSA